MNDYIVLILFMLVLIAVFILYRLGKIQKANIVEWLLYAVIEAEKQLGSGTGALKLRTVYDWFIVKYPITSKIISFITFSLWVDIALGKMKSMLLNEKIKSYAEGNMDGN